MESSQNPSSIHQPSPASPLRRWLLFLASIAPVGALVGLLAWGVINSGGNPDGPLINSTLGSEAVAVRAAPAFSLIPLEGEAVVDNATLRGKVVMVDFWSSWCPPCRLEAPSLAQVYREYADAPVEFVGVAIWDDQGEVLRHLDRYQVSYPNAVDDRGRMAVDFGVRGIPEKFFLDREGRIVKKYVGPMEPESLRSVLDELLSSP